MLKIVFTDGAMEKLLNPKVLNLGFVKNQLPEKYSYYVNKSKVKFISCEVYIYLDININLDKDDFIKILDSIGFLHT